jgi:hypothetical protein
VTRRTTVLAALLVGLLLSGCGVSLPDSGPVVETEAGGTRPRDNPANINPRGPGEDDSPEDVVRGFLEAMTATPPIKTTVAREFLTPDAKASWQPIGTIAYGNPTISGLRDGELEMTLSDADRTDARGAWQGPLEGAAATFRIGMAQDDDGQWRISSPPPYLMVPRSWFEQRLRQVSLYFFDPSGTVLVPEPVFAPRGPQLASTMVNGLLQGPAPGMAGSELTFFPADLRPVVSVPVSARGLAQVTLTSDNTDLVLAASEAERLVAQLAWTLRQDADIRSFRVSVDGQPVKLSDGDDEFDVTYGSSFAPYVGDASPVLYGLREGRLVAGSPRSLDEVGGPFGQSDYQLRSVALDMRADQAAGVASSGTELWVGSVDDPAGTPARVIVSGTDLLTPAYDVRDRLWSVDRRAGGAVVQYVRGTTVRTVDVPGISGQYVKDFTVSRDGTRLVAVVRGAGPDDSIVVSRIISTGDDQVQRVDAARDITPPETDGRIRSLAWRTPTSLIYLQPQSRRFFYVRSVSVDGASLGVDDVFQSITEAVTDLVGSPTPSLPAYAFAPGVLKDLAGARDLRIPVDDAVTDLTYVG